MEMSFLLISLSLLRICWSLQTQVITVLYVNEIGNEVAESAVNSAFGYIEQNKNYNIKLEVTRVSGNRTDSNFVDSLCAIYGEMLKNKKPPHLVLDTTMSDMASESVKLFTRTLALPIISASFGQPGDLQEWNKMQINEKKYLIQVCPPADIIPEVIRQIVTRQSVRSAAIMHDNTFVMDHKHKSLLQNIPTRHLISEIKAEKIDEQLLRMKKFDLANYFILGNLETIKLVLDSAWKNDFFNKNYAFHAITQDLENPLECGIKNGTILFVRPDMNKNFKSRFDLLKNTYALDAKPEIAAGFYFDLTIQALFSLRNLMAEGSWRDANISNNYYTCEENHENLPPRVGLEIESALKKQFYETIETPSFGVLELFSNGWSRMNFEMSLNLVDFHQNRVSNITTIAYWLGGFKTDLKVIDDKRFDSFKTIVTIRVVVAEQIPFIFRDENHPKGYNGYCIDLMDKIAEILKFEYDVTLATGNEFGNMNETGGWNGLIKDVMDKKADIGVGSISVMEERENVIDFTVPYYDLVGITILMKIPYTPTSLFKFLGVLEDEVWYCIIAAYFFTSFLIWILDKLSPLSFRNYPEKYKNDNDNRDFTLKECLWFCMTSLTPQGGGEAPKNLSGRLAAGTWWLFGFIIISSYTANLAAFLTVSRLETPIESLDDLAKQYKIEYAPMNGSPTATYFLRMKNIEKRFYEIWKDMSLNYSISNTERAKLAVWDYPVGQKYSKMWLAMTQAGFPNSLEEAVKRVKDSPTSTEGFAYLGDGTDTKYLEMTNCDLKIVGEEFSRKPYAFVVPEGSPMKDLLNTAIYLARNCLTCLIGQAATGLYVASEVRMRRITEDPDHSDAFRGPNQQRYVAGDFCILILLNRRELESLKQKWWTNNPNKAVCEHQENQSDGISIQNIGGVFIVIFVGIGIALITLAFEYWWYKYRKSKNVVTAEDADYEAPETTLPGENNERSSPNIIIHRRRDGSGINVDET